MAEIKKNFLDLAGLGVFKTESEKVMDEKDKAVLAAAKQYHDDNSDFDTAGTAATKVQELANGAVANNTAAIEKLNGADTVDGSVKKQIKDAISEVNTAASDLTDRISDVEDAIDAINDPATGIAKVAADALTTAKTELEGLITAEATTARAAEKANKDAITKLNGDANTDGSVAKSVKDAINDFAVKVSDDETVNTFKELVDWAASHSSEAAEMVAAIGENESAINALEELVGALPEGTTAETVVAYIDAVIKAEEDRATGIEDGLETRLATVEAKFTGEGSVAKQIEDAVKVEKDRAEAAESALDGKISGHETRIVALENVSIDAISEADIKALFTPAVTE